MHHLQYLSPLAVLVTKNHPPEKVFPVEGGERKQQESVVVSAGGLSLVSAARLGGEVTMSIKVPTYLRHGGHMGKKKLRDGCPQTGFTCFWGLTALCSGRSEDTEPRNK